MCRAQTEWNFQQRFYPQLALTLAVSGENNANTSWRQVAEKLWTQFVNRIQGEAWGRCYLGTYLVLPRYIDLKIVATKWKLTAVLVKEDQGQAVVSNARMADQVFGLRLLCNRLHRPLSRATGFWSFLTSDCHLLIPAPLQLKVEKSRRNQILILSYSRSSASSIDR